MNSKFAIRIFCQVILVIIPFLFLINSINYLTSNLYKQNKLLNNQKDSLTSRISRKKAQAGSDLSTVIEDKIKLGTIEAINPATTTSILQLQPKANTILPSSQPSNSNNNPTGIVIR